MNDLLQINVKKIGALFLCFCLLVMIGPPVLRLLPMEIILHYLSLFLMILVFTLSYMQRQLVFTKQRYILAFLFFLLGVSFGLPVGGHSWTAKIFLPLLTSVFIVFFDNQVYPSANLGHNAKSATWLTSETHRRCTVSRSLAFTTFPSERETT